MPTFIAMQELAIMSQQFNNDKEQTVNNCSSLI